MGWEALFCGEYIPNCDISMLIAEFLMLSFYVFRYRLCIQALAIACNILQVTKSETRIAI